MSEVDGLRIMVVEDNFLIADMIVDVILARGAEAVGPFHTVDDAMASVTSGDRLPDAAVLDVNLDRKSFEVAEHLLQSRVPFVFATGHASDIAPEFRNIVLCEKPFTPSALIGALQAAIFKTNAPDGDARPKDVKAH